MVTDHFSSSLINLSPTTGADISHGDRAFIGQFPIAIVAWLSVFFVLHTPKADYAHWTEKLARIDFLGAFTLVSAVFLLLFGLDNGANEGWSRIITIAPLALAPALFVIFVLIEMRVASHPFAPGHVIFHPPLLAAYGANFFGIAAHMAVMFFIALFFQAAAGFSAFESGLMFLPSTAAMLVGSLGGGMVMRRTGKYYGLTIIGLACVALSIIPLVAFSGAAVLSVIGIVAGLMVLSFGSGACESHDCIRELICGRYVNDCIAITTTLIAIIANAPREDTAIAIACSYLFRSLGSAIGISVSMATLQQVLRLKLAQELNNRDQAREIEEGVRQSLDYIRHLDPDVATVVRKCYAVATQFAFAPVVALALLALIAARFIKERRLDG